MKKSISFVLLLAMVLSVISPFAGVITVFGEETNIALGKTVSGVGSNAAAVTDGNKTTSTFWDGGVAPSEVIIDLGAYYDITKVNVITYYGDGRYYHYTVQVSDNGLLFETVSEKDDDNVATAEGVDHTFEKTGRYVKVALTKNSANPSVHLCEVSVYGKENTTYEPKPIEGDDPNDPDNIAYFKPVRSNSPSSIAQAANDGNTESIWKGEYYPLYVDIDLLANYNISKIVLFTPKTNMYSFDIYGSLDGVSYTRLASSTGMQKCTDKGFAFELTDACYRIIRVNITGNSAGSGASAEIADVKIYGTKSDSKVTPTRETISFSSYEEWLKAKHGVDLSKITDANGRYDIDATYTEEDTVKEIQGIVTRLLGEKYNDWFIFDVDPSGNSSKDKDYFRIKDEGGKIKISGTDGTCVAAGLNWYLKYYCNVHISQQTKTVNMPEAVVKVGSEVFYETPMQVRYAYNYCTLSYTMAFFGYDDWRRELDWLMLNGVNLVLDITATEALWVHYLQQLGYTADQAKDYVCGYSYKAWWLMGNLENYGGSVSDQWVIDTLEMARVNQRSLTVMGAEPALQTFVGAMPSTFGTLAKNHLQKKGFDDVSKYMAPQGSWSGLTRPNVLRTDYNGYSYLAQLFYDSQDYVYGQVTQYYCGDVCHEGGIIPEGLAKEDMASKILEECLKADEDAVWMLQVWWDNPMKGVLDGFGDKKEDHVILLDLAAATNGPKYTNTTTWGGAEYGGTPWVLCTLDNYGGRAGMHGKLKNMCDIIVTAKEKANYLKGIGITPEGTQNNPVMMDLFWEMIWRDETPKLNDWVYQYADRRYGESNVSVKTAWLHLFDSVYKVGSYDGTTINYSVSGQPKFTGYNGGYYVQNYPNSRLYNALEQMMKAYDDLNDNESYIYDLVDIMRTYLSNQCTDYLLELSSLTANTKAEGAYEKYLLLCDKYLDGMLLIDELSAYSKDELLGTWIGRVDTWVNDERTGEYDDYTKDMMEFNAKCLISAWCSVSLIDYANRQYNGLMSDYYYPAWKEFFESYETSVKSGKNVSKYSLDGKKYFNYAWSFIINDVEYSSTVLDPNGGINARGIENIFTKISVNHTTDAKKTPIIEISLTGKTEYKLVNGIITGVLDGTQKDVLLSAIEYPEGTTLKVVDSNGEEVKGIISVGNKLILTNSEGKVVDTVIVGGVEITSEEDKAKAEQCKKEIKEIYDYLEKMDKEGFNDMLIKRIEKAMKDADPIVKSIAPVGLSTLEDCLEALKNVKAQADEEYAKLHPESTETPLPTDDGAEGNNVVTIIIIAVVAVVVIAGAMIAVIVIKKKK